MSNPPIRPLWLEKSTIPVKDLLDLVHFFCRTHPPLHCQYHNGWNRCYITSGPTASYPKYLSLIPYHPRKLPTGYQDYLEVQTDFPYGVGHWLRQEFLLSLRQNREGVIAYFCEYSKTYRDYPSLKGGPYPHFSAYLQAHLTEPPQGRSYINGWLAEERAILEEGFHGLIGPDIPGESGAVIHNSHKERDILGW